MFPAGFRESLLSTIHAMRPGNHTTSMQYIQKAYNIRYFQKGFGLLQSPSRKPVSPCSIYRKHTTLDTFRKGFAFFCHPVANRLPAFPVIIAHHQWQALVNRNKVQHQVIQWSPPKDHALCPTQPLGYNQVMGPRNHYKPNTTSADHL